MLHRITLTHHILQDYERRAVFPRYWQATQHPLMDDISVRVNSDELSDILHDAELQSFKVSKDVYPNLIRAYVRLAENARTLLRRDPGNLTLGRDGKSAAAGD